MEQRLLMKLAACSSDPDIQKMNEIEFDSIMDKDLKTWKCQECGLINPLFFLKCQGCKNYLENRLRVDVIINIVRKYIPAWNKYYNNQFTVRTLFGSNINRLYLVVVNPYGPMITNLNNNNSNHSSNNNNNNNNNLHLNNYNSNSHNLLRVVVRIFRGRLPCTRQQIDEAYQLFYQCGLGPNILTTFEIGQIEEHIDGRKIYHDKQSHEIVWKDICNKMVIIHNIKPNEQIFNKEQHNFYQRLNILLLEMKEYIHINKQKLKQKEFEFTGKDLKTIGEIITLFPKGATSIRNEIEWTKQHIYKILKKYANYEHYLYNKHHNENENNKSRESNHTLISETSNEISETNLNNNEKRKRKRRNNYRRRRRTT